MKRKRQRKVTNATTDDNNIGATPKLARRHQIVSRAGVRGVRVMSRLEQWLERDRLSAAAGLRFATDYTIALGIGRSAGWRVEKRRQFVRLRQAAIVCANVASRLGGSVWCGACAGGLWHPGPGGYGDSATGTGPDRPTGRH
jgi:hypothetical protein